LTWFKHILLSNWFTRLKTYTKPFAGLGVGARGWLVGELGGDGGTCLLGG